MNGPWTWPGADPFYDEVLRDRFPEYVSDSEYSSSDYLYSSSGSSSYLTNSASGSNRSFSSSYYASSSSRSPSTESKRSSEHTLSRPADSDSGALLRNTVIAPSYVRKSPQYPPVFSSDSEESRSSHYSGSGSSSDWATDHSDDEESPSTRACARSSGHAHGPRSFNPASLSSSEWNPYGRQTPAPKRGGDHFPRKPVRPAANRPSALTALLEHGREVIQIHGRRRVITFESSSHHPVATAARDCTWGYILDEGRKGDPSRWWPTDRVHSDVSYLENDTNWQCCACLAANSRFEFLCSRCQLHSRCRHCY